jgi:hypothetical protein
MAENEESEWVGCQWMMQGFCGRRSAARQEGAKDTPVAEPEALAEPKATVEPKPEPTAPAEPVAVPEPAATPAKRSKRQPARTSRKDAWSAARKAAAARRTRRPAA